MDHTTLKKKRKKNEFKDTKNVNFTYFEIRPSCTDNAISSHGRH
jgi:hypothetical protein